MRIVAEYIIKNIAKHNVSWLMLVDLIPIMLCAGIIIAIFIAQDVIWWGGGCIFSACILFFILRKKYLSVNGCYKILVLLIIILLGFLRANYYLQNNQVVTLDKKYNFIKLQGNIEAVEAIEEGKYRLILRDINFELKKGLGFRVEEKPHLRLRLSVRSNQLLKVGDIVQMRASIFPPSRPAMQGAANFARYFYIKNIGGVGYSLGYVKIMQRINVAHDINLSNLRSYIDNKLIQYIEQPQAGIAIALITGGRAAIPRDVNQAMQIAGITHILSISGMHMSIVCGLIYFIIRLAFAVSPRLALHYPIKQYAAIFGLISGAFYLMLADFPIPAIRAYVMIGLIFLGIILFKQADALRSLMLAAVLLLLYNPLNILDVGFQLSFIATYGLIIAYRRISRFNAYVRGRGVNLIMRIGVYLANIIFSSFVAGMITAPFVLFHFGIFSSYSILGNMLTLPLISFIVMPALVVGLGLSKLWIGEFCLSLADVGLEWVIAVANWISRLPQSSLEWVNMPVFALCLMFAGILLILHAKHLRIVWIGFMVMLSSLLFLSRSPNPHLLIAEDGSSVAVYLRPDEWLLLRGGQSNFFVKQWRDITGGDYIAYQDYHQNQKSAFICDKQGCDGEVMDQRLRLRFDYLDNSPLCLSDTNISIATFYGRAKYKAGECSRAKLRIDRDKLERFGSHIITIDPDGKLQIWNPCEQKSLGSRC
jgi:competence protein ComEC